MSLFITSLNSGSNGNCYYIGNRNEAILIDIGISCRETEKRLSRLNLSVGKIKAVFVSHEHTDHIKGITVFAKKHRIPVYFSEHTYLRCNFNLAHLFHFEADIPVQIGGLGITAFMKHHDAVHPHSFVIDYNNIRVGVFTDIGMVCENLIHYFKNCNAAFLEANYCEEMLENGSYPYFLKNRIRSGKGHLSNKQALELFKNHRSENLSLLLLSHLSRENNNPELVKELFTAEAQNTQIVVASRYEETPVFKVTNESSFTELVNGDSDFVNYSLF